MWGALPLLAGLMLLSVAKGSVPLSLAQVLGALRLLDVLGIGNHHDPSINRRRNLAIGWLNAKTVTHHFL